MSQGSPLFKNQGDPSGTSVRLTFATSWRNRIILGKLAILAMMAFTIFLSKLLMLWLGFIPVTILFYAIVNIPQVGFLFTDSPFLFTFTQKYAQVVSKTYSCSAWETAAV